MYRQALLLTALAGGLTLTTRAASPVPAASLEFIENKGQWDARARYAAPLPAGRLFAERTALTYFFVDPAGLPHGREHDAVSRAVTTAPARLAGHAYTMHFAGASARAELSAAEATPESRNYFLGADESHWASNVKSFRRLRYANLWAGIGATIYENGQQRLEYDFLVQPRADAGRIGLRYEGVTPRLDAAGNLLLPTSVGTITELAPQAYQTDPASGQRQPVPCRYELKGDEVRFQLGAYDHSRALVIDPTVVFSSYTGSTADNWGFTATYDAQGNLYSGGIAMDPGYPASPGAFSTSFSGIVDIALIKYNTTTTGQASRVWATYLGGGSSEFPHSLVVVNDELVMLGSTSSSNYPTTSGALGRSFRGGSLLDPYRDGPPYTLPSGADLVVTRFSADGRALRASTYLGGSGNDGVQNPNSASTLANNYGDPFRGDVLGDSQGNLYIVSNTSSADFPGLSTGFNGSYRGGASDALVCKLPPSLDRVLWAGLLGGNGTDAAYSIRLDGQGRTYVCGGTTSANFPFSSTAYLNSYRGDTDGFVARISADGRQLERATAIGTSSYDQSFLLQLDAVGNAYVFGQTLGSFPQTPGLYGVAGSHQFIQKLDPDLGRSIYSTTFGTTGTSPNLVPTAFLVDDCERVFICGWGGEVNSGYLGGTTNLLPTTPGAIQSRTDGSDFYLAQFAPGLRKLDYATFFGQYQGRGEHVDGGTSRFDPRGIVYQSVCASCQGGQGFPRPPGAGSYSATNGSGNCNNAAFKIDFQAPQVDVGPRRFLCAGSSPVTLGGSPAGGVWTGPGVTASGGSYQFAPAAVGPGSYVLTYTTATTGICQAQRSVRYTVTPPVTPSLTPQPELCTTNLPVPLRATPAGGSWSGPGVVGGARFDPASAGAGTHTLTYSIADTLVCGSNSMRVDVRAPVPLTAGPDTVLCADRVRSFQLRGFAPLGGAWSGSNVTPAGFFQAPTPDYRGSIKTLTYSYVSGPCVSTGTRRVIIAPSTADNVSLNLPQCANFPQYGGLAPFDCPLQVLLPGGTYDWDFGDGSPHGTTDSLTHHYERPGTYRIVLTARYADCLVKTSFAPLEVGEVFVPNIITPNGDDKNETFQPRFSCEAASLRVFSRWGQEVYHTDAYRNDWRGENLADGTYYYLLRDAKGRTAKGWVEVKR